MRCSYLSRLTLLCLFALPVTVAATGEKEFNQLRGETPIDATAPPPPIAKYEKTNKRRLRNYPEQPPTIPHSIAGYEISLRGNKCLSCHSRRRSVKTGAPMVGVSHFMNREFQILSDLSPRRYFCTQCHAPQAIVTPPVGNDFIDAADIPKP